MNLADQYQINIEIIHEKMKPFSQETILIAVSKYVGELEIQAAYQSGQRDLGKIARMNFFKKVIF